jgi:phage tail-like protein
MAEIYYPPSAFYFGVVVAGSSSPSSGSTALDASFSEVSGIEAKIEIENVQEGGENRFVRRLPGRTIYPNLVLKRGLVTAGSFLAAWFAETVGSGYATKVVPTGVQVNLLGDDQLPRVSWVFENAYPVSWKLGPLDAQSNQLAVETMELAYEYFYRADWD